jgi:hypothetical protein
MTPAERAAAFERILRSALPVLADAASPPKAVMEARATLAEVTRLIDALHGLGRRYHGTRSPVTAGPHDARAREAGPGFDAARAIGERGAEGLRRLRKGRHQCEATTRAGARCKAPAVPGGSVCTRHGGAAPQVRLQAAMTARYEARLRAGETWKAARGTPGEFDALCAWSRADNAVNEAEAKIERIGELRAELRRRKTAPNSEGVANDQFTG